MNADESDLTTYGAAALRAAIASGTVSSEAVTRAHLARIDALNPVLNAICTPNPEALADARAVDERLAAGGTPRALEGVPFVAKDNLDTAGLRTTLGTLHLEDRVPDTDALSVARMKAHGAVLIGKSNTPEFAADINTTNAIFGQTRNCTFSVFKNMNSTGIFDK